jgi:hypothetical protein
VPFVNGQTTEQTVASAQRLGRALGLQSNTMARLSQQCAGPYHRPVIE